MASTFLQLSQDVADEVGVTAPDFVIGNTDQTARRMRAVGNAAGRDLVRAHEWSDLIEELTITTEDAETTYDLPANFGRLVTETTWAKQEQLRGSLTPRQLAFRKQLTSPTTVDAYRLRVSPATSKLVVDPVPAEEADITLFYVNKHWVRNSATEQPQDGFTNDTDTLLIDEQLVRMSMVWRLKNAIGMPYAEERLLFEDALKGAVADDLALGWQRMGEPHRHPPLPRVPERSWGV